MRKSLLTVGGFLFTIVVVLACTSAPATEPAPGQLPANAPGGLAFISPIETPPPGVTVTPRPMQASVVMDLALSSPVVVNQPVTLTISIRTRDEIVDPLLSIGIHTESARQLQLYTMTLPTLAPGGLRQVIQPLLVPGDEGRYRVDVFITDHRRGANHGQALRFTISGGNVILNPTPRPVDAPPTIELIGGTRTVLPTRTRQAPGTAQPPRTPPPEAAAPSRNVPTRNQTEINDETQIQLATQLQQLVSL